MPLSRKKACAHCRQSKLRCNLQDPCSHCAKKRLRCIYNGRDSERLAPYPSQSSSSSSPASQANLVPMPSLGRDIASPSAEPLVMSDTAAGIANVSVLDVGGGPSFEWDALGRHGHPSVEAPKSLGIETAELQRLLCDDLFPDMFPAPAGPLSHHLDTMNMNMVQPLPLDTSRNSIIPLDEVSSIISIERTTDQRTLRRRFALRDCVLTSVVLGQLTGYPKMMLEGDTLPPFIQPPCHSDEELAPECRMAGRHKCLPKTLAICTSLVDMFYSRTPANEDFVWEMIYAEGARLRNNFHKFNREEQLAAMQAITVFILLQADDLKPVIKNDASSLLMTGMECIVIMATSYKWGSDTPRVRPKRHEWAFGESLRRVAMIFCIIDLLLEGLRTPDGHSCDSNGGAFGKNTLPCNRFIWEARTTRAWMMHYDAYLSTRESDETLTGSHLLEAKLSNTSASSATKAPKPDVLRWCEGLDALGTLVWMVLPLHAHRLEQIA